MYRDRARKNFMILFFWNFPVFWAVAVVQMLQKHVNSLVTEAWGQCLNKEKIFKLANQYLDYKPTEIDAMIRQRKKQHLKRLLENYHTLGNSCSGIRYDKDRVMGGYPVDMPHDVILKIFIDKALDKLKAYDQKLAKIMKMRYIEEGKKIKDIEKRFKISESTVFRRINEGTEKLIYLMERGLPYSILEELVIHCTGYICSDKKYVRKIVTEIYNMGMYSKFSFRYNKFLKKNKKNIEKELVIHRIA